jgi:hypothetical protein
MKKYTICGTKMTATEIERRFYSIYCPPEADEEMICDIESFVAAYGLDGMKNALRWFYIGGEQDFYIMIQYV